MRLTPDDQIQPSPPGKVIYKSNPSVMPKGAIARKVRRRIGDERRGFVIGETGEILGDGVAVSYQFEEVDKERFVKLFLAGVKQAIGMSKAGLALFEDVYDQMRDNKDRDFVMLAPSTSSLPLRTYQRGLKELLDREFLFRSPYPGMFWVNIRFMFNGDRLAFVKGYKLKGADKRQGNFLDKLDGDKGNA